MNASQFKFKTPNGSLSAILEIPNNATHTLLLAHGAGADYQHKHMHALAAAFNASGIATMRFNFPFTENGKKRVDAQAISLTSIQAAAEALNQRQDLPLLIGGHSYGGRMATHAAAEGLITCSAMILCSFALHPAGKASTERAQHLQNVKPPMLFLSGSRDAMADPILLTQEIAKLNNKNQIHWLETADHSYKILKRTRTLTVDVYTEAATAARSFIDKKINPQTKQ